MDWVTIFFIALGLSMDATAVALASGCAAREIAWRLALRMAFFFGFFQMLMPVLGWLAGLGFKKAIASFDHWLAFGLLLLIGLKMIREAYRSDPCRSRNNLTSLPVLLGLAVATSIDALAVGLSFSLLAVDIIVPVLIIGIVTFILSFLGVLAGHKFGALIAGKVEILGGLILIAIGCKILLEHLHGG
ncbi:MAG: manganese efflux pump [Candidatus Aminicenantes bacterium]|nr:manganese efflux pump [Candidatus Aminicenantes bacterium]